MTYDSSLSVVKIVITAERLITSHKIFRFNWLARDFFTIFLLLLSHEISYTTLEIFSLRHFTLVKDLR